MKKRFLPLVLLFALILATSVVQAQGEGPEDPLAVLGTGFTYQGQLSDDAGSPLNGSCDFNFSLWDALTGGAQVGAVSPVTNVTVAGGYFSAVVNGAAEFGSNAFKGSARWLEVSLRCPAGAGTYTTLSPRQALTAAPYARYAANAPWSGLSGIPADLADGDNDTTYTAGTGITLSGGAFSLGTAYRLPQSCTDGQIAEWDTGTSLWVCAADNSNTGDITGVTAGSGLTGGGTSGAVTLALGTAYQLPQSCTDGQIAEWNTGTSLWICAADDNTIYTAGSGLTLASGAFSVNFGGNGIAATAAHSDHIHSNFWLINGNSQTDPAINYIGTRDDAALVFKVNGLRALLIEPNATSPNLIGGYNGNTATAGVYGATIGGGGNADYPNTVTDDYGTVSGGKGNTAELSATVSGGAGNTANYDYSAIGGGLNNVASAYAAAVSGGVVNVASGSRSSIGGGSYNTASGEHAYVGGGTGNSASTAFTTISGGNSNEVTGMYGAVGGGWTNAAGGGAAAIGGGSGNTADGEYASIGGGLSNSAGGNSAAVGGGNGNSASGAYASVGGGEGNTASGEHASIGGGNENTASAVLTTISGGDNNEATGLNATVGGGVYNFATGESSVIGGGYWNTASGARAIVSGGANNSAAGDYSFVAGRRAQNNITTHDGVFLFADSSDFAFHSTAANQFRVRATGGVQFVTAINGTTGADTAGVQVAAGGGSWSALSDRSLKANLASVDSQAVLQAVAGMPISTWNYTAQDTSIRHIGPMAQDFYAAFNVGEDERHITTIDADGVALAAIQGLNEVVEEKEARISALEAQVARLQNRAAGQTAPLATPWPWLALCVIVLGLAAILRRPAR